MRYKIEEINLSSIRYSWYSGNRHIACPFYQLLALLGENPLQKGGCGFASLLKRWFPHAGGGDSIERRGDGIALVPDALPGGLHTVQSQQPDIPILHHFCCVEPEGEADGVLIISIAGHFSDNAAHPGDAFLFLRFQQGQALHQPQQGGLAAAVLRPLKGADALPVAAHLGPVGDLPRVDEKLKDIN